MAFIRFQLAEGKCRGLRTLLHVMIQNSYLQTTHGRRFQLKYSRVWWAVFSIGTVSTQLHTWNLRHLSESRARRASQMGEFDNEIERWSEVDVPYLPSQLICSSEQNLSRQRYRDQRRTDHSTPGSHTVAEEVSVTVMQRSETDRYDGGVEDKVVADKEAEARDSLPEINLFLTVLQLIDTQWPLFFYFYVFHHLINMV
ncbi:hypothetical protein J6590_044883 [Homalodisca vitripennis]|nr:hypothetical protein J6590_044883 [Homalodisca vitripennis]